MFPITMEKRKRFCTYAKTDKSGTKRKTLYFSFKLPSQHKLPDMRHKVEKLHKKKIKYVVKKK